MARSSSLAVPLPRGRGAEPESEPYVSTHRFPHAGTVDRAECRVMPTELRRIRLSEEETLQAIQSYACMTPDFLPNGRVLGFRLVPPERDEEPGLVVSVDATYGGAMLVFG